MVFADNVYIDDFSLFSSAVSFSQNEYIANEPLLLQEDNLKTELDEGIVMAVNNPGVIKDVSESDDSQNQCVIEIDEPEEAIKYVVRGGDTTSVIANSHGIKMQTLLWANNLDEDSIIQPGNTLTIPPKDGLMYTVESGDTLSEIVEYFEADIDEVTAFNQLDLEYIAEGQELFLPNGKKPIVPSYASAETSTPSSSSFAANLSSSYSSTSTWESVNTPKITHNPTPGGCHSFPYGYCTWYVAQKRGCVPWGGDAKAWLANAPAYGYSTGSNPVPGAVMVTRESWWGHVAYVESVNGDSITISEMNKVGWGISSTRTISRDNWVIRGYIY